MNRRTENSKKIKIITHISAMAAIMVAGAFIKIPFVPVPLTLQTLFSIIAGIMLGWKYGALSQIIYILLGLTGLPVFTDGGGIGYIFNSKFGYLLGFVLCSFIVGIITEKKAVRSFTGFLAASVIGAVAVYIIGVAYLFLILNVRNGGSNNFTWFFVNGFALFIPGDILKCIAAAFVGKFIVTQPILRLAEY